ncbi:hypothetical protein [Nannocystis pusilla]|uniref:hypothetical protein n=1 Tax=Nannocystis pusilla TaxID=889268 RepID=UPI003DA35A51
MSVQHPRKIKGPKPIWRACGEGMRDRLGFCAGFQLTITYHHLASVPKEERYELRFSSEDKGRFGSVPEAVEFAKVNVQQWIDDHNKRREEEQRRREAAAVEAEERAAMIARVAQELRDLGVEVRVGAGLIIMDPEDAEKLVGLLRDLRRIEESGHV